MTGANLPIIGFLSGLCLVASWLDMRRREIPNWLCMITAISGLAISTYQGGLVLAGSHGLHAVISLAGGLVLFALELVGGGDAKFYAAVATWFSLRSLMALLTSVTSCGLVLLFFWFIARRVAGKPVRRRGKDPFDSLPYGIAISAGAVLLAAMIGGE